jgi:hypothetical protein
MELWNHVRSYGILPITAVIAGWTVQYALDQASPYLLLLPMKYVTNHLPADDALIAGQVAGVLLGVPRVLAVSIAVGWIVGRLHRPRRMAAVVIFVATYVLWEGSWLWRLLQDAVRDLRYASGFFEQFVTLLVAACGVVLGGVWSAPADDSSSGGRRKAPGLGEPTNADQRERGVDQDGIDKPDTLAPGANRRSIR